MFRIWSDSTKHSAGDDALGLLPIASCLRSQQWQFSAEFIEHGHETIGRGSVGGLYLSRIPESLKHDVNRTVLKMKTAAVR